LTGDTKPSATKKRRGDDVVLPWEVSVGDGNALFVLVGNGVLVVAMIVKTKTRLL
jgi:hypothetical protein